MARRESEFEMRSVGEALECVLRESRTWIQTQAKTETVAVHEALGRVVSEEVTSPCDIPAFPASMKDGYCLALPDPLPPAPHRFQVADTILAGQNIQALRPLQPNTQVYKIMTGAPVPPSCNAVIMVENTTLETVGETNQEEFIRVEGLEKLSPGTDIRAVGSDCATGTIILDRGEVIGPAEMGLLASCGIYSVQVYASPRVGVLSTGDEVRDPSASGEPLQPGHIFDANRPILRGLLQSFDPSLALVDLGIAEDNLGALSKRMDQALEQVDVLITSGGVSMGEVDLVKQ